MPATKSSKRSSTPNVRSPVQHWLAHLKLSTLSESHNLLQHSSMMKNKSKYSIIHITRNLLRILIVGNKNYCKLAGRLNAMILLGNGSDAYEHLTRMQKIVQESHEYFVEYMRHYVPQHVQASLVYTVLSTEKAISSVEDYSDYVDTENRKLFTSDAVESLKSQSQVMENIKNPFTTMVTETYKVILSFMEGCASDLLNQTIMKEVMRHLSTITHAEFVANCLRMAEAIPLFLKHPEEEFYQALLQLCRVDVNCSVLMSEHIEELCRVANITKNEDVRSCALEIISSIVGRAAKALNVQKPIHKLESNGVKNGIIFSKTLYDKLSVIATMATKQLYRVTSINSTSVYHSTLRTICGVWRIATRRGIAEKEIDLILSRSVESLIAKLDAYEDRDPKSRHLTMMVIAMLARSRLSQEKLEKKFVVHRLLEILDETHQQYIKSDSESQTSGSGYVADSETTATTRSTSCESLIKGSPLTFRGKKQVTFASDCTLTSTRSKLYMASAITKSRGSLPNLSSPSLSLKSALTNGMSSSCIFRSPTPEDQSQFHQQILHNCAFALARICANSSTRYFQEHGGPELINRIINSEKSNKAILPYLNQLRDLGIKKEETDSVKKIVSRNTDLSPTRYTFSGTIPSKDVIKEETALHKKKLSSTNGILSSTDSTFSDKIQFKDVGMKKGKTNLHELISSPNDKLSPTESMFLDGIQLPDIAVKNNETDSVKKISFLTSELFPAKSVSSDKIQFHDMQIQKSEPDTLKKISSLHSDLSPCGTLCTDITMVS